MDSLFYRISDCNSVMKLLISSQIDQVLWVELLDLIIAIDYPLIELQDQIVSNLLFD